MAYFDVLFHNFLLLVAFILLPHAEMAVKFQKVSERLLPLCYNNVTLTADFVSVLSS
jgi:hypothetical protein